MKRREGGRPPGRQGPPARAAGDYADPYKKVRRPRPPPGGERGPEASGPRPFRRDAGERAFGERERRGREGGFTVTLDPDVARVFRGDASVNKALRLVMQMAQVMQGPPGGFGPRAARPAGPPRGGYRGSAEARGFTRKPRFEEDEQ